jgi:transcriptional regulator with XRE-family HTH domain
MTVNAGLEDLMLRHGLGRRDIAELLGKPLNSAGGYSNSTVDRWLAGDHRVPATTLELLRLKLSGRTEADNPWLRLLKQPMPYPTQRHLERDLAPVLDTMRAGNVPKTGRVRHSLALRRAGYLLELTAYLGGPDFTRLRRPLLAEADRLRRQVDTSTVAFEPFRAGVPVGTTVLDDLAARWRLSPGADIRRFRQLAHTGHV